MSRFDDIQQALDAVSPVPADLPKLYLLGDTGAGKTTIIRKLLGTEDSKFPTTRQIRTTVAFTEYIIHNSDTYDVAVVLKPLTEVEEYINEILKEAISRFQKDRDQDKIIKNLRQTSDQRFRLYFLLSPEFSEQIKNRIIDLSPLVDQKVAEYQHEFPEDEPGLFVDFALTDLGDSYTSICSAIIEEVQRKAKLVCNGDGLESSWKVHTYSDDEKVRFIAKCKELLSSEVNSISPLIDYARIRGNLAAPWLSAGTEVVIVDSEGNSHDTKEAGQFPSRHYDYFYRADAILLIEKSKEAFISGGGKGALKSIFERGYGEKLLVLFTKLDEVEPYDTEDPTNDDRVEEVRDGLTNVLSSLKKEGQDIDLSENGIFYLGGLKKEGMDSDAISQINAVLARARELSTFKQSFVRPEYDFEMLSAFLMESTKKFNELYKGMLDNQHWQTIKAFNLRMKMMGIEEGFRMFMPITDFENTITVKDQGISPDPGPRQIPTSAALRW